MLASGQLGQYMAIRIGNVSQWTAWAVLVQSGKVK